MGDDQSPDLPADVIGEILDRHAGLRPLPPKSVPPREPPPIDGATYARIVRSSYG